MLTFVRTSALYYTLFNLAILCLVGGAVTLIANNLERIPPLWFITGFGLLTLLLIGGSWLAKRREAVESAKIWAFWAGITYGLALFAGAHWFSLTSFIPDLLLCWIAGLALLAFWQGDNWQMGAVALLTGVWFYLVFLYGYGYLPGVVLLGVLYFFVAQRQHSALLFVLAVLLTLLVINLYFYDFTHPAHFPLAFSTAQMLITLALLGGLHGVVALLTRRNGQRDDDGYDEENDDNDDAASPWYAYGEALHKFLQAVGVLLLAPLTFSDTWTLLRATFAANLFGIILGFGLLMITAIFLFSRPTTLALRTTFAGWALGYFLLAIVLDDHMMDMVHFTGQAYLPLVGIGLAVGASGGYLIAGLYRLCLVRISTGLGLLLVATVALLSEWVTGYQGQSMLWFGLALVVWIVAQNLYRQSNPILAPLADGRKPLRDGRLLKEGI